MRTYVDFCYCSSAESSMVLPGRCREWWTEDMACRPFDSKRILYFSSELGTLWSNSVILFESSVEMPRYQPWMQLRTSQLLHSFHHHLLVSHNKIVGCQTVSDSQLIAGRDIAIWHCREECSYMKPHECICVFWCFTHVNRCKSTLGTSFWHFHI